MTSAIIAGATAPVLFTKHKTPHKYTRQKLIYGVGRNDFPTSVWVDGKPIKSYTTWRGMIQRCYSADCQKKHPTYIGCSVAQEWHSFAAFEKWYTENYIEGLHLDKDILVSGNKQYSADLCVFVSQALNGLLTDCARARGALPLGVSTNSRGFRARIHIDSVLTSLGTYDTPLEAHQAWQLAKASVIEEAKTDNPRARTALDKRAYQLRTDAANGIETTKL